MSVRNANTKSLEFHKDLRCVLKYPSYERSRGLLSLWWPLFIRMLTSRSSPFGKRELDSCHQRSNPHIFWIWHHDRSLGDPSHPSWSFCGLGDFHCVKDSRENSHCLDSPCYFFFSISLKIFLTCSLVYLSIWNWLKIEEESRKVQGRWWWVWLITRPVTCG